jgi:uncharacterized protein (TIGR04551 family)
MYRLAAALAASLLLASQARAQEDKKPEAEIDARTRAAIQREVERAKEDIRNEVRAEIQGAQSAAEFLGAVGEGPKLEFLELDGYLRVRGQMMVNLDLTDTADVSGRYLFPVPLQNPGSSDTLNTANMRLRLEPTLNVSEHVRVRAQVDVLDNHVLGASASTLHDGPGTTYPAPFYGASRVTGSEDPRVERPVISPKRAWAEVQTPVGLLSFGRMPSHWGLGLLTNAGAGIDDDFGDSIDRIQFAIPPVMAPIGRLVFVPSIDFDYEGVLYADPRFGRGVGQPFDADAADDGRTYGLKIARLDTEDEVRRKLERNERSVSYGLYYNYRSQRWTYPAWSENGFGGNYEPGATGPDVDYGDAATAVHRSGYAHIADLWVRWLTPRWRVEVELAGIHGQIGNASDDPAVASEKILLRQWGGSIVTDYKVAPNRVTLGLEIGAASGDDAPGFGNVPSLRPDGAGFPLQPYGSVEGAQWGLGDRTVRNFRFNPAYRVDLILWRQVLGQVTDAMYVKPKLRWDIFPGVALDASIVYSRALFAESTPSAVADLTGALVDEGSANLGIEADAVLTYTSGDGFQMFAEWGVLQPLGGLDLRRADGSRADASRAHFLSVGLAARF